MKEAIIISDKDMAGQTIKEQLEKLKSDLKIYTVKKDSIHCENIDKEIDADIFVFSNVMHPNQEFLP